MSESSFHDLVFNFCMNLNKICSNIFTFQLLMYIMNDQHYDKIKWLIRCDYTYLLLLQLMEFFCNMNPEDKVMVFVGKKSRADDISSELALKVEFYNFKVHLNHVHPVQAIS